MESLLLPPAADGEATMVPGFLSPGHEAQLRTAAVIWAKRLCPEADAQKALVDATLLTAMSDPEVLQTLPVSPAVFRIMRDFFLSAPPHGADRTTSSEGER